MASSPYLPDGVFVNMNDDDTKTTNGIDGYKSNTNNEEEEESSDAVDYSYGSDGGWGNPRRITEAVTPRPLVVPQSPTPPSPNKQQVQQNPSSSSSTSASATTPSIGNKNTTPSSFVELGAGTVAAAPAATTTTTTTAAQQQQHQPQQYSLSSSRQSRQQQQQQQQQQQPWYRRLSLRFSDRRRQNRQSSLTTTATVAAATAAGGGGGSRQSSDPYIRRANQRSIVLNFLNNNVYYFIIVRIIFSIVLLFGGPVRDLVLPRNADGACNVIFTTVFVVFTTDILIRIYTAEFNYFHLFICKHNVLYKYNANSRVEIENYDTFVHAKVNYNNINPGMLLSASLTSNNNAMSANSHNNHTGMRRNSVNNNGGMGGINRGLGCFGTLLSVGSFLFWCDILSTLTLLYDITYINPKRYEERSIYLYVNEYGLVLPQSNVLDHSNEVRQHITGDQSLAFFVAILKAARTARFLRSKAATKFASQVDWYFLLNFINPMWWVSCLYNTLCCWMPSVQRRNAQQRQQKLVQSGPSSFYGSNNKNQRDFQDIRGRALISGRKQHGSSYPISRRKMFSSSLLNMRETDSSRRFRSLFRSGISDAETRHNAAIVLQKAWRNHVRREKEKYSKFNEDNTYMEPQAFYDGGIQHKKILNKKGGLDGSGHTSRRSSRSTLQSKMRRLSMAVMDTLHIPRTNSMATGNRNKEGGINARDSSERSAEGKDNIRQRRSESQVGNAMREITGQRVAIGIILAMILTSVCTYREEDSSKRSTMITLHTQTKYPTYIDASLDAARNTSTPDLFSYTLANGISKTFTVAGHENINNLRPREKLKIIVEELPANASTIGEFSIRSDCQEQAVISILTTLFIMLIWYYGVTAFAGPVMILVVIPIERMVRLLAMLMGDPLGYQKTPKYRKFVNEEDEITKNTRWTKEILKGMESSFLMSTILRIGSLMKVGFGSAGVEIIQKNIKGSQSTSMAILSSQKGSKVSCIFLFCDIRNFTDATECLQEEVFVFTNRIAAVVHSNCAAYGGSANKNIGDAFLLSWLLDEDSRGKGFAAKKNQADKALLAVIRMCMALRYDDYYLGQMSEVARGTLITKLMNRPGPIVQMGFGLHAGKAVQGAIGSQKKIDATYISEAVEHAEFLESSTKKYGLLLLMSDSFHMLLDQKNRRRCRKVDQILIPENDNDDNDDGELSGDVIDLITFDIDIDRWWDYGSTLEVSSVPDLDAGPDKRNSKPKNRKVSLFNGLSSLAMDSGGTSEDLVPDTNSRNVSKAKRKMTMRDEGYGDDATAFTTPPLLLQGDNRDSGTSIVSRAKRKMTNLLSGGGLEDVHEDSAPFVKSQHGHLESIMLKKAVFRRPGTLVLPTGKALYNANVWFADDMRIIRERYSDGIFFQKFNSGLLSFYSRDWDHAKECFTTILNRFEDGPSRYFLNQIEKNSGKPPRDFRGYGIA